LLVLGISDTIDSGAALVQDGRIIAAVNEERLTRRKFHTGFPFLSIPEVLRVAGVPPRDVDRCAYAGDTLSLCTDPEDESFETVNVSKRLAGAFSRIGLLRWALGVPSGIRLYRGAMRGLLLGRLRRVKHVLRDMGVHAPLTTVDHHTTHAASAAYTCGWPDCLVVSIDASGDGYCSLVAEKRCGRLRERERIGAFHSLGIFYLYATLLLGHKPGREGKLTGLAAHGDPAATAQVFRSFCDYDPERGFIRNSARGYACDYAALKAALRGHKPQDIAAGVQRHFEQCITSYVRGHVRKSGLGRVALAGGVFANVRVNQRVREMAEVEDIYVFPQMGDGGGAVGAAMHLCRCAAPGAPEHPLDHLYYGPAFSDAEIAAALRERADVTCRESPDPDAELAQALARGRIAARFDGPMEYGPRALGNRSILYRAADPAVNDWLNKRLRRTEYMPFAPTILEEHAAECLQGWRPEHRFAWFMTATYDAAAAFRAQAPAVVHVDNSTRPQVLRCSANPGYHRLIREYQRLTGLPFVLNTSFNMHEEPIVCTPRQALAAFVEARLDLMALGRMIVEPRAPTT